MKHPTNTTT